MELLNIELTEFTANTALIHYKKDRTVSKCTYKELIKQIVRVGLILEDLEASDSSVIVICTTKSPAAVALALGILEFGKAFCFCTNEDLNETLLEHGVTYFFSDNQLLLAEVCKSFEIFGSKINLCKALDRTQQRVHNDLGDPHNRICYTITTSGSTGRRKAIRVLFKSIIPNILSIHRRIPLSNDVILSSAPLTFDVFMLDCFLAFHSGSALLIVDDSLRYDAETIKAIFSPGGATFLQITPSLLQAHGLERIQKNILAADSSLK